MPDCRAEIRIHDDRWGIFTVMPSLIEAYEVRCSSNPPESASTLLRYDGQVEAQ